MLFPGKDAKEAFEHLEALRRSIEASPFTVRASGPPRDQAPAGTDRAWTPACRRHGQHRRGEQRRLRRPAGGRRARGRSGALPRQARRAQPGPHVSRRRGRRRTPAVPRDVLATWFAGPRAIARFRRHTPGPGTRSCSARATRPGGRSPQTSTTVIAMAAGGRAVPDRGRAALRPLRRSRGRCAVPSTRARRSSSRRSIRSCPASCVSSSRCVSRCSVLERKSARSCSPSRGEAGRGWDFTTMGRWTRSGYSSRVGGRSRSARRSRRARLRILPSTAARPRWLAHARADSRQPLPPAPVDATRRRLPWSIAGALAHVDDRSASRLTREDAPRWWRGTSRPARSMRCPRSRAGDCGLRCLRSRPRAVAAPSASTTPDGVVRLPAAWRP